MVNIPQLDRSIYAGRHGAPSITRKGHTMHLAFVPAISNRLSFLAEHPQLHRAVSAARNQVAAVRTKSHTKYLSKVAAQGGFLKAGVHVPQLDCSLRIA